jgi:NDP-sugar pyrophosphorylase family protein
MLSKEILKFIPDDNPFGFDNLMLALLDAKKTIGVKKYDGYWLDIGRPDDYMQAIEQFDSMQNTFLKIDE